VGQVAIVLSIEPGAPDLPEARTLIAELDALLEPFYTPESRHGLSVERLVREEVEFFLMRVDGQPAGCGGVLWCSEYGELKRMYARPQFRGLGIGARLIEHIAELALQRGLRQLRLETGIHQTAAIRLYEAAGFVRIRPFGPYREDPLSLCFARQL